MTDQMAAFGRNHYVIGGMKKAKDQGEGLRKPWRFMWLCGPRGLAGSVRDQYAQDFWILGRRVAFSGNIGKGALKRR